MANVAELGRRIKLLRLRRGWSQEQLAMRTGPAGQRLTRPHISKLEGGKIHSPGADSISKIALALDVEPAELLEAAGYIQPAPPGEMYPVPVDSLAHYVATLPPDYQAKVRRIVDMITEDQDKRGWTGKPKKDSA